MQFQSSQGNSPRASPFVDRDENTAGAAEESRDGEKSARVHKNSIIPEQTLPAAKSSKFVFKEDAGVSTKKRLSSKVLNALQVTTDGS